MTKYNLPMEETKRFEIYNGRNIVQMPKLIADGRVPLHVSGLMQRRLDLRNDESGVKTFFMDNYFDTGDAVAYKDDKVKIVLDSTQLRELSPKSQIKGGALVLGGGIYETLKGPEFTREELESHVGNWLSAEQARSNLIWKVLARDQALLDDYVPYIFAEAKKRFNQDTGMGVFLADKEKAPTLRAWYVRGLGDRSYAGGWGVLGDDVGRLVGIAPEALVAPGMGAGNVRTYTMADVETAKAQLTEVSRTIRDESLDKVVSLIRKLEN